MGLKLSPQLFEMFQGIMVAVILIGLLRFQRAQSRQRRLSGFRDRDPHSKPSKKPPTEAEQSKQRARLLLQGVVLTGLPHQILNVREDASEFEIRRAHRQLIKRFHPDKVGSEGSREWYEAQRASEVLNNARDEMLKKLK